MIHTKNLCSFFTLLFHDLYLSLQGLKLEFGDLGNISLCLAFLFCIRFWSEKLFVSRVTFNQIYFVISQSLVETNGQAVNHKETRAVSNGVELLKNSHLDFSFN